MQEYLTNHMNDRRLLSGSYQKYIFIGVVASIILGGLIFYFSQPDDQNIQGASSQNNFQSVPDAQATTLIDREFGFPIKNQKGEEISKLQYKVENAELRDKIVIKSQNATAATGRIFLVINIKLKNDSDKSIEINTKDYLRLSVNNNDAEWLAADVHNDPVLVQPISTKYTRLAFPINTSDKDFKLRIGEISGEKQIVEFKF